MVKQEKEEQASTHSLYSCAEAQLLTAFMVLFLSFILWISDA